MAQGEVVLKIEFDDVFTFLLMGDLDADAAKRALLHKQYFPAVKSFGEELPDLFDSQTLTVDCADELAKLAAQKPHQSATWTELRTRRFDGLVRRLGVPHPVPYARLVLHVTDHWQQLAPLLGGAQSQIKPRFHQDGRMIQMDYETSESSLSRDTRMAQGQQFMVKADISNCFPSIYSHSIDWAVRGKSVAKKQGNDHTWQANLDTFVRNCHDRETKGLMIGPAVSNLISELILQRVDDDMTALGHDFTRYIDDYTSYCLDRDTAERFVVDLQHSLATYRLDLNTRKTKVVDLRHGVGEPWMSEVRAHLPRKATPLASARFLRQAELLAAKYPSYSVLKFAVKSLPRGGKKTNKSSMLVVDELVRLCTFHPHLAPFLASKLAEAGAHVNEGDRERIGRVVTRQLIDASRRAETDVVLWNLYILRRVLNLQVKKDVWEPLLMMDDDLVTLALATLCPRTRPAVRKRVLGWDYPSEADRQQHWLVRYELRRVGILQPKELTPVFHDDGRPVSPSL